MIRQFLYSSCCVYDKKKIIKQFANSQKFFGFQSEILIQLHQVMSVFFTFINRVQEADCEAFKEFTSSRSHRLSRNTEKCVYGTR